MDFRLGTRPAGDAGRYRRRQCGDRRPGRRPMGLSAAATAAAADADALHGAGIDGAAGHLHRARPRRTDPRTVWRRLGVAVDGGLGGGDDRLAGHRIHRRRGDRRTLWPVARSHLAHRRGGLAHRRRHRLLPARGADSDRHRPVRTRLFRGRLGGASEPRDLGKGRGRPAPRQPRIHVSGGGGHRSGLQSMDDLLPTVRHCRQEAAARRPQGRPLGYGVSARCLPNA